MVLRVDRQPDVPAVAAQQDDRDSADRSAVAVGAGAVPGELRRVGEVRHSIPGLELVDLPEAALCCGSAGIYNMIMPDAAADLGVRKAENVRSVEPDVVVTANPGCLLQIGKYLGRDLPLLHPVQMLEASSRGAPVPRS